MKKNLLFSLLVFLHSSLLFSQAPKWDWAKSAGGSNLIAYSIATDARGNSYVSGYFTGGSTTIGNFTLPSTGGSGDMFVAKYDPNGNVLWARSAGGSSGYDNGIANGIAVDSSGNVYVCGYLNSSSITFGSITLTNNGTSNMFFVKYDANGNVIWAKNPGGSGTDICEAVTTDTKGNIFLTGYFTSSSITFGSFTLTQTSGGGTQSTFIAKYDAAGNVLWASSPNAAGSYGSDCCGSQGDSPSAITTDKKGNVYITGEFSGATLTFGSAPILNFIGSGYNDAYTVKYDSTGNVIWAKNFGGTSGYNPVLSPSAMAADSNGNVYITGYFENNTVTFGSTLLTNGKLVANNDNAYFIAKYDSSGNPQWAENAGGWADFGYGIATDASNNIYVVGYFVAPTFILGSDTLHNMNSSTPGQNGPTEAFFAKYNSAGNVLWTYDAGRGGTNGSAGAFALSINSGNIYTTGTFDDSITLGSSILTNVTPGTSDLFIAKLSTCGLSVSTSTVNSTCGNPTGSATAIVSNGTPPYTYFWTDASKKATDDSLASGLYIVTVTDSNGCQASATANIVDATAPAISVTSLANVTCPGGSNGSITISVAGGTSPYTYYWDNGSLTQNISKLSAGPYQVEITDANGCRATQVITITQPPSFAMSVGTATASCGGSDGSATLTVSGGTGSYTYLWTPSGQTTYSASGLAAGSYSVMVIDSSGCKDSISADVENAGGPIVTITNITAADCFTGTEGTVSLSVTGGTSPYTYSWSNGATSSTLTAPVGYYNLIVTDSSGCKGVTSAQIQDTLPQGITLCEVTVDSNQQNEVFWNRTNEKKIASYNIYRETTANGVYRLAASQPADSLSMWIDPIAVPQVRGYKYEVSEVDSCGDESVLSPADKTMQLSISPASGCGYNLFWNNYIGYNITQYLIFRDSAGTGFRQIDSVNASKTSWTDHTCYPASDSIAYFVEAEIPTGCTPTNRPEKVNNTTTRSNTQHNIALTGPTAASALTSTSISISIYPNPANERLNIVISNAKAETKSISIVDVTGREVYSEPPMMNSELSMNIGSLATGIYFVKVTTNTSSNVVKFVKE
ncbi:MAG: SBBP repeat-containing protein [Bacteroidia bacterium]